MQTHTMAVPAQNISSVVIFRDPFSLIPIWSLFAKIEFGVIRILKFSILIPIFRNFYLIRLTFLRESNDPKLDTISNFTTFKVTNCYFAKIAWYQCTDILLHWYVRPNILVCTHKTNAFLIKLTAAGLPPFCLLPFSHLFC